MSNKKFSLKEIEPLLEGEMICVFSGGWDNKNILYEDSPFDQNSQEYEDFINQFGDREVCCFSTHINDYDSDYTVIAILIKSE